MSGRRDGAALIEALIPVVRQAGALIEEVRREGVVARDKADASPVTQADERAEALLVDALGKLEPGVLIIGEEACAAGGVPEAEPRFWLLDPLDGTREFVEGGEDYSVNVGLVVGGEPVLGLLLSPRSGALWAGVVGEGAFREDAGGRREAIATRPIAKRPVALTSRSFRSRATDDYLARVEGAEVKPSGSSLKFCILAEGGADIYPRFGATSEWDTAAGHAILCAAGGAVRVGGGGPLVYGKAGCRNGPFLAVGDPAAFERLPEL